MSRWATTSASRSSSALLSSDKSLLDKMTFWIIPSYNPDGGEHFWRGNANRIDLNRNWYRAPQDGPPASYSEPESRAFYAAWAAFKPHYAIDIHHQGTYFVEGTNEMTTFSIGIPVSETVLDPWVWDTNRKMAVTGYDAVAKLGFVNPTRYPKIDIRNAVVSSMMLDNPGPDGTHDGVENGGDVLRESRRHREPQPRLHHPAERRGDARHYRCDRRRHAGLGGCQPLGDDPVSPREHHGRR